MTYILSWTTKKHQKPLSRPLHSKLETFPWLPLKFKDFSRLCEPCVDLKRHKLWLGSSISPFETCFILRKTVRVSGGLSCRGQLNVKFAILIIYSYWFFSTSVYRETRNALFAELQPKQEESLTDYWTLRICPKKKNLPGPECHGEALLREI